MSLSVCGNNDTRNIGPNGEKPDVCMVNANVYRSAEVADVCGTSLGDGSLRAEPKQAYR